MSKLLFSVINPIVKVILRSPLHRLMSHNTVLLEFEGRNSGRSYSTPVSYFTQGDQINCFTSNNNQWWRNLRQGHEITLILRGKTVRGKPAIIAGDSVVAQTAMRDLLISSPRDALFAGVGFDADGKPLDADIKEATASMVLITITPVSATA